MQNSGELEPEAYIRKIREVLKKPGSEDERFRNMQFLHEADAWLSGPVPTQESHARMALLHVRVMRALRDWERTIGKVRSEEWGGKKVRARALVEAAIAHVNLQEFASADSCLDETVTLDPGLEKRVAGVRSRLEDQLRLDLYGRMSAFVYRALEAGDGESAKHLYMSASHVFGLPAGVSSQALDVLAALVADEDDGARSSPRSTAGKGCGGRLVITCGSGYSGTGAVTAYLRELEGLPMPFGVRELAVLKKSYGLHRLLSKWDGWSAAERAQALRETILKAILGVPCYESPSSVDRIHTRSITWNSLFLGENMREEDARFLGASCAEFVRAATAAGTSDELGRGCAAFLNRILRFKGSEVALLNNCIHQTQIRMCGLLEDSRVVVVVRDPRDQYVAHQTETPGKRIKVEAFIKKRKRADAAVKRYLDSGAGNVRPFSFEAFVTDPKVREEVRDWAGLSDFRAGEGARFFYPEKSQRNVGIYGKWEDRSDIDAIESELKDQLVDM